MKRILYILIAIFWLSACTDGFDKLNINPNSPVTASMPSIMIQAQRSISGAFLDDNDVFSLMVWTEYHGRLSYSDQAFNYDWKHDNIYNTLTFVLLNLEKLRTQAVANEHVNYEAIAMIMKAWIFANWTDMNGEIPYFDALKGETDRLFYPKYDDQKSIYMDLVSKLKEAAGKIELTKGVADVDAESDLYGQGDMLKWKKFANSLRARMYLRMSEVDGTTAKAGLEEIFGNLETYPVMAANDDNVTITYLAETGSNKCTFVGQTINDNNLRVVGATIADLLCANNDPRRTIFMNATENSIDSVKAGVWAEYEYSGAPAAVPNPMASFNRKSVSTVGDAISKDWYRPIDIMTYAEVMFIRAEAASKGYAVGGTAKAHYEAGITASMKKWGVADAAITKYISEPFATFNAANAKEQILTQRYIDGFHQALNTFAMIRRGGFPKLGFVSIGFAMENGYPDRMPYSSNQKGANPDYFNGVGSEIILNLWGNMWWASKTEVVTNQMYIAPAKYKFAK